MHFTKLSCTARLLLVAIVGTRSLGDGFAIRDALLVKLDLNLVDVFQTPFECAQMEFALAVHEHLAQLLALFHHPCRIFLTQTSERSHHLFRFGFVHGADGAGEFGIRIFDEVETMFAALAVERVARAHIFEFHRATNVARGELTHLFAVSTRANEELCHTFLRTAIGILQIVAFFDHTAHHLEVLHFTDVRFYTSFEEINAGGSIFLRSHGFTARVEHSGHFINVRHHVAQKFHQATHAHVFCCANAEYGEDAASDHAFADAFAHFVFGELFCFKELLHELFVIFSSSFHQSLVKQSGAFHFFSRNVFNDGGSAFFFPREFLHQNHVDETVESSSRCQRILHGNGFLTIDGLQIIEDGVVVAILVVKLIDKENDRLVEFFRVAEVVLRTHFRAKGTIDEEDGGVCHIECSHCCSHKVVRPWTVYDVEFLFVPFHVESCGKDRIAIFLFNGEVVRNGIFLCDSATSWQCSSVVEHTLREGGFSRTVIAKEGNVFDVVRVVNFHTR